MYSTQRRRYLNGTDQISVGFEMDYHDWCKLQKTELWASMVAYLSSLQKAETEFSQKVTRRGIKINGCWYCNPDFLLKYFDKTVFVKSDISHSIVCYESNVVAVIHH